MNIEPVLKNFQSVITKLSLQVDNLLSEKATLKQQLEVACEGLKSIEEYWNGNSGSAVDAAEESRSRAGEALAEIKRIGGE